MALTVKKVQPIGDLLVTQPQPQRQVSVAAPLVNQAPLTVNNAPVRQYQITSVGGAAPSRAVPMMPRRNLNPLNIGDWGKLGAEFTQGVGDMLNPLNWLESGNRLATGVNTAASELVGPGRSARMAQESQQEAQVELIKRAAQAIQDPTTSPAERLRWQKFVRDQTQRSGYDFMVADDRSQQIQQATDPVQAAVDIATVAGGAATVKGASKIADTIATAVANSAVKREALELLTRQGVNGARTIPVSQVDNAAVTIPTRVSTPTQPKVALKAEETPVLADQKLLNIKIKNVKDPARKAELIAERNARFPKKEKPMSQLAKDIDQHISSGANKKKDPGVLHRTFGSISNYLERSGDGGKLINRGVQRSRDYFEKKAGDAMVTLRDAGFKPGMKDESVGKVWDAIESGNVKGLTGEEKRLATGIVKVVQKVRKDAVDAGMDIGDLGSTYLPRWYKNDDPEMLGLWNKKFNQRFGNLEKKRLTDEEGYEKTAESLARYVQRAYERIGRAKEFGQNDEDLEAMLKLAASESKDKKHFDRLERYTKNALGDSDQNTGWHRLSDVARQYEAYTSLQRSAFANAGQQVNTITVAGIKNWGKGAIKYITDKNSRDWAARTGVYGDHILGSLQHQYAGVGGGEFSKNAAIRAFKKHVAVPGMQAVEKFNRANSVLAGREFAKDLLKKSANGNKRAQRQLKDYFPDLKSTDKVTDEQIVDAARQLVKRTQFKVDPVDLPNWATDSPVGKLIFQFRSFGYRQTNFLAREVIGEALRGNFAPMVRFLAVGVPVGAGIQWGKDEVKNVAANAALPEAQGDEEKKSLLERAIGGFSQVGGGGLPLSEASNVYNSVKYGNTALETVANVGGPLISDIGRAAGAVDDAVKGKWNTAAAFAASQIPVVGPIASEVVKDSMKGNTKDPSTMSADELDKYKKTTYAKFSEGMSDTDKDLLEATSNQDYARMGLKSGKFTQDKLDDMQAKLNRNNLAAGLPVTYVNSITDEEFNGMTDEMKAMVLEASLVGKTKFKDSTAVDKTSQAVITKVLESAWPEVGDVKASNKLALEYLKSQQDYTAATDDAKRLDVVKGFWNKAVKEQYPDVVKNVYNNSLADIKRLMEGITVAGVKYEVGKGDIDAAVALDDRLLAAGLRDTPKFSNKTRKEWGYGEAATSKIGSGYDGAKSSSSGGGGGSSAAKNPYRYTVSRGSRSSLSGKASASGGRASVKLSSNAGGNITKPKVSLKKSKV